MADKEIYNICQEVCVHCLNTHYRNFSPDGTICHSAKTMSNRIKCSSWVKEQSLCVCIYTQLVIPVEINCHRGRGFSVFYLSLQWTTQSLIVKVCQLMRCEFSCDNCFLLFGFILKILHIGFFYNTHTYLGFYNKVKQNFKIIIHKYNLWVVWLYTIKYICMYNKRTCGYYRYQGLT